MSISFCTFEFLYPQLYEANRFITHTVEQLSYSMKYYKNNTKICRKCSRIKNGFEITMAGE